MLAGASPSIFGLVLTFFLRDRTYMCSFLKRIITVDKARAKHILSVFMLVPSIRFFSTYVNFIFSSVPLNFSRLVAYFKDPAGFVLFAVFTFIFGPFAEEIGWRGYLLDCWKDKGIWTYGVGIGFIWALWHLPMFFIEGTYQNSLLLQGSIPVICFAFSTTVLGVIIGQVTRITNSILLAILFHFTVNFAGELIPLVPTGEIINTVILTTIAFAIICKNSIKRKRCHETEALDKNET